MKETVYAQDWTKRNVIKAIMESTKYNEMERKEKQGYFYKAKVRKCVPSSDPSVMTVSASCM